MPELPDLEVVKDILTPRIVGQVVRGVEVNRVGLLRTREEGVALLVGRELQAIGRRGKYLAFSFGSDLHLLVHLMRWAWLWHGDRGYPPTTATDLRVAFEDGTDLRLIEARSPRLAAAWMVSDLVAVEPLQNLGREPLSEEFTVDVLRGLVAGRRRPLKRILTDQSLIAGIGNAYADEILFRARLSPVRYGHTLTAEEQEHLWRAIGDTLRWAIAEIRGRTGDALFEREIRDFLSVHGRKGAPCPECGTPIAEILYDGARTNYCPRCQGGSGGLPPRGG
ncbi:MAG: Fpg/Nei family DNA glycosylase [Candidatus Bipolaricaulota bacterium]